MSNANSRSAAVPAARHPAAPAPQPFARGLEVAVLLPCFNEEVSIGETVARFRRALPCATVFVYDNRSTDRTAEVAARAGAVVRAEPLPGKGNVVRRMFTDVEADVYVVADGDDTYEAEAAASMIARLVDERLDMVIGTRHLAQAGAHRRGHATGNRIFNALYRWLFGRGFTDIFSGYRVLSRRFVKSFPALAAGFEIETEMSVHASQLRMPVAEVDTRYAGRAAGSSSKLRTLRDGARILSAMAMLLKEVRPLLFFGAIGALLWAVALALGWPVVQTWRETGLVPRLPTALLATGLTILGALAAACGLVLDSVARGRLEQKRFAYLSMPQLRPGRSADGPGAC